jgi:hypothetical protein
MTKKPDKMAATEAAWTKAIAREALIRPLASATRISAGRLAGVCRDLGLKRTRLYELIALYRAAPVASSLLDAIPGQEKGSRRLSAEVEHIIEAAMRDTYRSRERPTVRALHHRVRELCHEAGVRAPCWKAVALRVQQADQRTVYRDREGAKVARQRFEPVVQEYKSDYAFQIVQMLNIGNARSDLGPPNEWLIWAFKSFASRDAPDRTPPERPKAERSQKQPPRRSDADYLRLATAAIKYPRWNKLSTLAPRNRSKAISRLARELLSPSEAQTETPHP